MSKNFTNILVAAVAGLAAGVAIGLLIAPDKGSETRKKIRKTLEDFAEELGDSVEEKFGSFRKRENSEATGGNESTQQP